MKKILVLISMFTMVAFLSTTNVSAQKATQKVTTEKAATTDKAVTKDAKCADKPASCSKSCAKSCSADAKKACGAGTKTETQTAPVPKK
jgi:hypothetical protein